MMYVGGKAKIARWVASAILSRKADATTYLEPFVGSGAVFAAVSRRFDRAIAADAHEDLMLFWAAIAAGWMPPRTVSLAEYEALAASSEPSAMRGFVGFGSSYAGKWFGGYARAHKEVRNYAEESRTSAMIAFDAFRRAELVRSDYREHSPREGWLVYCDPPYAGTQGYAGAGSFDSSEFWKVAEGWRASGAIVLVSEYSAPAGWAPLGSRAKQQSITRSDRRKIVAETIWAPTDQR